MRAPSDTTNGPLQEATTLSHLPVPGAQSLLQVYPPDGAVVVGGITWEDERLYIRLYNTGTAHTPVQLEFSRWTPREAWRTDLVGRPQERLSIRSKSVKVHVPARGVVTLALR
ncbi:MAG: glycosyl hydrolase-related protein [Armatimonadota bacterium]